MCIPHFFGLLRFLLGFLSLIYCKHWSQNTSHFIGFISSVLIEVIAGSDLQFKHLLMGFPGFQFSVQLEFWYRSCQGNGLKICCVDSPQAFQLLHWNLCKVLLVLIWLLKYYKTIKKVYRTVNKTYKVSLIFWRHLSSNLILHTLNFYISPSFSF